MRDPKTKKMAQLLEVSQSSYFPAFKDLFKEIVSAMEEAQDISDNLKPIAGHFESLETTEFDQAIPAFDPMFHTICLIWAHSKYYCRPARIIILLQELNNLIIKRATEFVVVFNGPLRPLLPKQIYCLEHPTMGKIKLLFAPSGASMQYQATLVA